MIRVIKHQGYCIKIHNFDTETNLHDFQVIGDFEHTATIYNGIDGFIDKTAQGYELRVYLKTNRDIFIEKYNKKSFNDCIKMIKHYIDCFITNYSINLSNKNKFYCDFELNTISIYDKSDLKAICNDLKQNNINFAVKHRLHSYTIKVFKTIISYGNNTITIK